MSTAPADPPRSRIVVGVVPDQPAEVLETAATFAVRFGADLILAVVDDSRFTVEVRPDGSVVSMPIDPDLLAEAAPAFDPDLRSRIGAVLTPTGVSWSERVLAGSPSQELGRLAEEVDAAMIVVGVRRSGLRGSLHEFFNGSVAIQLAHRQRRPLVVVPLRSAGTTTGADGP
ncbi:universal stress protein [Brevibacterium metallidurans]|uniref:UspA domain-containing protein n=1 Tax=Brevibacterium metallidurans TaxID=1482676 RepID=A0ABN0SSC1_9MICO